MRRLVAVLSVCLMATAAMGAMETASFTAIPSQGAAGLASYTANLNGGYVLGDIDWSGFATTIQDYTYGNELTLGLSGPLGSATITLGTGTSYAPGAAFAGISNAFSGMGDPAGTWTFDFYESYDDGADGLPDATWDNIDFGFNEGVEPMPAIWCEGFEGTFPPTGWSQSGTHSGEETWYLETYDPYEGAQYASCQWDPDLIDQDEWLISPAATAVETMEITGASNGSTAWMQNYDVNVWILKASGDVLVGNLDETWTADWTWAEFGYDLSSYLTVGEEFSIGFQYAGNDGAQVNLDDVCLRGIPEPASLLLLSVAGLLIRRR